MLVGVVASQVPSKAEVVASGGVIADAVIDGVAYRTYTFTGSGSFILADAAGKTFDILLVGGGASGGTATSTSAGGGGGGDVHPEYGLTPAPAPTRS
ncbi:MAG: hypothetical protein U1E59_02125 [Amaricoccus sp.]